ncbi:hypothetical protein FACS189456_7280 [Bacteroidia bacterium]|nr:hypothetical protein FACS189456_7280 [Bacteroidia bacterium]
MQPPSNLFDALQAVKDPRRKQGQRYPVVAMLLLIIMSSLRNHFCYREIGRFCKIHEKELIKRFHFKNNHVPSHVTIRAFIKETDFASIQAAFHKWTRNYVAIEQNEWISIDGKCIRSTVSDYSNEYQNFVSLVSLFCRKREQILLVEKIENKKGNESDAVEQLLAMLDLQGVVLTLDALHCKKNAKQNCIHRQSLCCQGKK